MTNASEYDIITTVERQTAWKSWGQRLNEVEKLECVTDKVIRNAYQVNYGLLGKRLKRKS